MSNDNKTSAWMLHLLLFIEIIIKLIINDVNFIFKNVQLDTLFFFAVVLQLHNCRMFMIIKINFKAEIENCSSKKLF